MTATPSVIGLWLGAPVSTGLLGESGAQQQQTAGCTDTADWADSSNYECTEYESNSWCSGGAITNNNYAGYGAEENCCACGKPGTANTGTGHCGTAACTDTVWATIPSNNLGTCGTQITWVQANEPGMSVLADACNFVATQASTPECAPCVPPAPAPAPQGTVLLYMYCAGLTLVPQVWRARSSCRQLTHGSLSGLVILRLYHLHQCVYWIRCSAVHVWGAQRQLSQANECRQ